VQAEKPAAQTAHLFFLPTHKPMQKNKRAVFCQHLKKIRKPVNLIKKMKVN
jgi:hypothetical protein